MDSLKVSIEVNFLQEEEQTSIKFKNGETSIIWDKKGKRPGFPDELYELAYEFRCHSRLPKEYNYEYDYVPHD